MKFFNREKEIALIREIRDKSHTSARFTVITGRRRIGKTQLIKRALADEPYLYFYIARKTEKDLCAGFQRQINDLLDIPVFGEIGQFEEIFHIVLEAAKKRPLTLVIDEFQEFYRINPSVFSAMANLWDDAQKDARINLIVCGSVNRLMNRIFRDDSEPLYGRNTGSIHVEPFRVWVLKEIMAYHCPDYTNESLLALWTMTGGVARYVEQLMDDRAFTKDAMLRTVFRSGSSFLDEGLSVLVQEFGKDYGTYFSILSAIAAGKTEYSQIKNAVGEEVGAFLSKLEKNYALVRRRVPIFASGSSKSSNYAIDDCFFRFWFRFVYGYQHLLELQRYDEMLQIVERDFETFSGLALERYFHWKFVEETGYTRMDAWWDRKGENEIDLVCEDEIGNRLDFYEIKRDASRIALGKLEEKAEAFFCKNPQLTERKVSFRGLSLEDM